MRRRSFRQTLALLLGVLLVLGPALAGLNAGAAPDGTAAVAHMGACCDPGAGRAEAARGGACALVCATPGPAVLPAPITAAVVRAPGFPDAAARAADGRAPVLEPHPPRPHDRG